MLRNLSTGIEASATGESLNSGDVAVHPAARHRDHGVNCDRFSRRVAVITTYSAIRIQVYNVTLRGFHSVSMPTVPAVVRARPTNKLIKFVVFSLPAIVLHNY